jgi:bacterioferritin (cytochrome b1)
MLKNWGLDKLAKHEYEESIEEMKHADRLIERVLMLDGLPNLQDLGKLLIGESAIETMQCDLKVELGRTAHLKEAIAHCEGVRDYVSRELLAEDPRGHRGAHRPPRDPARAGGQGRRAELPAVADVADGVVTAARRPAGRASA